MNSFSALRECELARTNARSVNDAIAAEDWDSVLVNYQAIARNLNDLLHCNINFDADVKVSLSEGIGIINHNCNVVERLRIDSPEKLTKGKQFTALRKIDPIISKTYFNLERLSS
jgi:hypothetical protein